MEKPSRIIPGERCEEDLVRGKGALQGLAGWHVIKILQVTSYELQDHGAAPQTRL